MLAFSVRVDEVDKEEPGPPIAYWYAESQFLTEIEKLVADGDAFVVEYHGGYPNKYEVYSGILRDWLEDADPRLHLLRGGRSIYKLDVNYERLDAVLDGELLSVEIWDQS